MPGKAAAANAAPVQPETPPAVQMSGPSYSRLKPAQMHVILQMAATGKSQKEIAAAVDVSDSTVCRFLQQVSDPQDVVQKLMKGDSLNAVIQWKRATRVAAKRGDHRPAREWIEAAYPEMRPQPAHSAGGGGVTINIGAPGQPLALPDITIGNTPLSPPNLKALGEGQ